MTWRTLFIKESEYIKLKLDNLEISKQGSVVYVPLSDIAIIIIRRESHNNHHQVIDSIK